MKKPHQFRLKLGKSHLKYKLKSLERYRDWFPPADVIFEIKGESCVYETYVDRANRLKLDQIIKQHPDIKSGDHLFFTPISGSHDWLVVVQHATTTTQATLVKREKKLSRPKPKTFDHSSLQEMLTSLSSHFGMHAQSELVHEIHRYDVIWRRITTGNPVKVFEVQVSGNLESALTKLKHARDLWNADVFLVVTSSKDAEKARHLLGGSFHEMASKTTIIMGSEVYEMLTYKDKFSEFEDRLKR
ncbi:MAG: hypothetical protein ACFFER_15985 [Candidatus Thorarchaeota archaeon]